MRKPNYDKFPATRVSGDIVKGWEAVSAVFSSLLSESHVVALECYTGVYEDEFISELSARTKAEVIRVSEAYVSEQEVCQMTERFMTDDVLFGYVTPLKLSDYFCSTALEQLRERVASADHDVIIMGAGASLVSESAPIVYADMARWEIQQRFRRHEVCALGVDNSQESPSVQYKRGYFNDWRILDAHKDKLFNKVAYWLDSNVKGEPKMISSETFFTGIEQTAKGPFRVVPFFDPAPWGGQWMKEVCDLDKGSANYGWCFDCVPEENSLFFDIEGTLFELPSVNLVLLKSRSLLGESVEARFGKDFPIRFDFLDTIGGGNLSLQVHPTTQFIRESFGMYYTQDESYYMLDASDDAVVYLGVKNGVDSEAMLADLRAAQRGEIIFDAEKYVNKIPAKRHDHFLIPGGTIHCSGGGGMVLEISSTPSIFTFKLWDWQRLGLDGKPRPINVERGSHVINWNRDTDYVYANLRNHVTPVSAGEGWSEERTGLHPNEFIETRRHRFSVPVEHDTQGSVNVLNLVEGEEAIIESPDGTFSPFVVHYAETFIIPASVGRYTIRPYGASEGGECMTIKAYVRF